MSPENSYFENMMKDGQTCLVQSANTSLGDNKVPDSLKQREAANADNFHGNENDVPEEMAVNKDEIEAARALRAEKLAEAGSSWTEAQEEYGKGQALLVNGEKVENEATAEKSIGGARQAIDYGDKKLTEGDREYGEAQATPVPPPTAG